MSTPARGRATAALLAGAAAGLLLFLLRFGPAVADPFSVDWIGLKGDRAAHHLAWCFFRQEAWHWPPARIEGYFAPVGTTVGLCDAIPVAAMTAKLLLPRTGREIQLLGPWLLLSYLLQGALAVALARRVLRSTAARIFAVGVILTQPAFLYRNSQGAVDAHFHVALGSHFLILAGWLLVFGDFGRGRRGGLFWGGLLLTAALVHPYLAFMLLALAAGSALDARSGSGMWGAARAGGWVALLALPTVAGLLLGGTLLPGRGARDYGAGGFGYFSANLLSFADADGHAWLGPDLPQRPLQYEGFAYLGMGMLLLALGGLARSDTRRTLLGMLRRRRGTALVATALVLLAFSHRWILGPYLIVNWGLPGPVETLVAPLRSSGRFVWPVLYLAVLGLTAAAERTAPVRWAPRAFTVLLAVQLVDLAPLAFAPATTGGTPWRADPAWDRILAEADTLYTHPPLGSKLVRDGDTLPLARIALDHGLPFTAGLVARPPEAPVTAYRKWRSRVLRENDGPRPGQVVVVHPDSVPPGWERLVVDGYEVLLGGRQRDSASSEPTRADPH